MLPRVRKGKPRRLELVFQRFDPPLYFVTFNTHRRGHFLAEPEVHAAFIRYCRRACDFHIGVDRYVIMPDHVHLFVRIGSGSTITLSDWLKGLKRELDRILISCGHKPAQRSSQRLRSFWQPGFHDRLLRSDESYAAKWQYVFENPVRAGLVNTAQHWPYAGEIVRIGQT